MKPFAFARPDSVPEAVGLLTPRVDVPQTDQARALGGGTNLVDLMKSRVLQPSTLVDLRSCAPPGWSQVESHSDGSLSFGALVRNSDAAYHPEVQQRFPLVAAAILAGASAQIRNMATVGGNLLQRTRCMYFQDPELPCNKRRPHSGCSAIEGLHRNHAILGTSPHCIATHPSDLCVALAALDAEVLVVGPDGERRVPFKRLHRLPGDRPEIDHTLDPAELITSVHLPAAPALAAHSSYLKVRDRQSFAFALVSVAAALSFDPDGGIAEARVALGGVAAKPWRQPEAEAWLKARRPTEAAFTEFANALLSDAQVLRDNAFKLSLARRAIVRALTRAAAGTPSRLEPTP